MSFSQAVSGMNAASQQLDVIGNNIANSATVGFKSSSINFADLYAGSKVGMGVKVVGVVQNFNDGSPTTTNNGLDLAISNNGFFRLVDSSGQVFYSRNGQFQFDDERNIINAQGLALTGYPAVGTPPTIQQGASPVALSIPINTLSATNTTKASLQVNLNSNSSIIDSAVDVDSTDEASFNFSTAITTYDSLGNEHNIQLFFTKRSADTSGTKWEVNYLDSSDPTATLTAGGTLLFNTSGVLQPTATGNVDTIAIDTNSLNGSAANSFQLSFANSIQQNLGSGSSVSSSASMPVVDGYATGSLTAYSINNDGTIVGIYSNKQTQLLGQVVLADFANRQGLDVQGNNVWTASTSSGQAMLGVPNTGTFGQLTSGSVEASNVDLSQELVNMIVAQRNYQSNSQTIKTQDQILNTLVNLR